MQFDAATIERMVQDVLKQLQPSASVPVPLTAPETSSSAAKLLSVSATTPSQPVAVEKAELPPRIVLTDRVITADLLKEKVKPASQIVIGVKSLITPAGQDFLRLNRITWERGTASQKEAITATAVSWRILGSSVSESAKKAVSAICQQRPHVKFELVGTAVEAAASVVSAVSRAEVPGVVVLTSTAQALACRVNRHHSIRAAVVFDLKSLSAVETTLHPNVVCIDPADRSFMELQNLLNRIVSQPPAEAPAGWE